MAKRPLFHFPSRQASTALTSQKSPTNSPSPERTPSTHRRRIRLNSKIRPVSPPSPAPRKLLASGCGQRGTAPCGRGPGGRRTRAQMSNRGPVRQGTGQRPARLATGLDIDHTLNGTDVCAAGDAPLSITDSYPFRSALVLSGPHTGVGGGGAHQPWGLWIEGDPHCERVPGPRAAAPQTSLTLPARTPNVARAA
jgi:hypothetical protein